MLLTAVDCWPTARHSTKPLASRAHVGQELTIINGGFRVSWLRVALHGLANARRGIRVWGTARRRRDLDCRGPDA